MSTMASVYDTGSSIDISADVASRGSKEIDSLPAPSIMGASAQQSSSWNINQKLVELLQYLNPLMYARLAQSLIQSMLESIGSSNVSNYNTRLTTNGERNNSHSMAAAVPADAIAIDCSYGSGNGNSTDGTKSAGGNQFITVSPEFEYLPDLELGPPSSEIAVDNNPANVPGSETVVQMSPIPELASDVQMRAATEQAATHSDDPSSVSAPQTHFASSVIPNVESSDKDKEGIETNVASMDDVQIEAEQSTTPVAAETKDENTDGDTRGPKKGKRKKNKGKGKSK